VGFSTLGLVGLSRPSAHAPAANVTAQRHPITTRFIERSVTNFTAHSFGVGVTDLESAHLV
jgi:hypothetical protein